METHRHPPHHVFILSNVSTAHVCECQWGAAPGLFYELHYWFPILVRRENVIMHGPALSPFILAKYCSFPFPLSLTWLSLSGFFFILLLPLVTCTYAPPISVHQSHRDRQTFHKWLSSSNCTYITFAVVIKCVIRSSEWHFLTFVSVPPSRSVKLLHPKLCKQQHGILTLWTRLEKEVLWRTAGDTCPSQLMTQIIDF